MRLAWDFLIQKLFGNNSVTFVLLDCDASFRLMKLVICMCMVWMCVKFMLHTNLRM